jgi:HNH endonuclease
MAAGTLRVSHGARQAVLRRCGGACERCGLEWPWELYLFPVDPAIRPTAANLVALCLPCSAGIDTPFAPLLAQPTLRDRLRARNNARTGAIKLTAARRRRLVEARGARCERCGISGAERQLEVHHRLGVFRGGDDSEDNLEVLCFACHHHVQPCANGCGRWAKQPAELCQRCRTEQRLAELRGFPWAPPAGFAGHLPGKRGGDWSIVDID